MVHPTVAEFNSLPRPQYTPTASDAPNHWYFDLRYIPLEPDPTHILFLVQIESAHVHIERLPITDDSNDGSPSGISYFPESGRAAAPELCKALVHSFTHGCPASDKNTPGSAQHGYAPWRLTTRDQVTALAVGEEFKRFGVRAEVCTIQVARDAVIAGAQRAFDNKLWRGLVAKAGLAHLAPKAPDSIGFSGFRPRPWPPTPPFASALHDNGSATLMEASKSIDYTRYLLAVRPIPKGSDAHSDLQRELGNVVKLLNGKTAARAREEADAGDADSAIDYALRLQSSIGVIPDRNLFRYYLVKVITSPTASGYNKARAHALLIEWCTMASVSPKIRDRYFYTAAYHAECAAQLADPSAPFPAVLSFLSDVLVPQNSGINSSLMVQYSGLLAAFQKREEEIKSENAHLERKRRKRANRYVCAAVECFVQADTGKMLSQCAGKCDLDKKPSYCSKECRA
ncbi:hypothetical protein H0H81_005716 [Sphagnurus paluster]|uniref:MYND-type domain-containing protein n=1 Tax=Sphagnurus paluster TaxID=117069 RepID=A0A9P7K501_9AGAR|nr:hypothetical protein H0H81_005716 [Sphagnurus paluster]